jgi:hypothetical protein
VRKFLIHVDRSDGEIARLRYSASRVAALVRSGQAFVGAIRVTVCRTALKSQRHLPLESTPVETVVLAIRRSETRVGYRGPLDGCGVRWSF